jgi:hypothetical protein
MRTGRRDAIEAAAWLFVCSAPDYAVFAHSHPYESWRCRTRAVPAAPRNALVEQDERLLRTLPVTQYGNPMLSLSVQCKDTIAASRSY